MKELNVKFKYRERTFEGRMIDTVYSPISGVRAVILHKSYLYSVPIDDVQVLESESGNGVVNQ